MSVEDKVKTEFGDRILETIKGDNNCLYILIDKSNLVDLAVYMQNELGYTLANFCVGTDFSDKMEVSWFIGDPNDIPLVAMKVTIDRENPVVPSLTKLWKGFNWHERETYDMLGIIFEGHDDLRRLIMPEDWEGHPLREDYVYRKPTYRKPEER